MSWLGDYLEYTDIQEAPQIFHFWTGLTTMAAVLGRRVWLDRRAGGRTWYKVYPGQMMTILVSPPGTGNKGTAMRFGRELMIGAGVRTIKGKGSSEKIINMIATPGATISGTKVAVGQSDAVATIIAPELSVFLSKQNYAEGLITFLTDIYDAETPFDYMTMKGNVVTLHNPCVTLLSGSNPTDIGDSIPEKAQGSGFKSRIHFVWHNGLEKPYNSLSDIDDEDMDADAVAKSQWLQQRLLLGLEKMKALSGRASWADREARQWFDDWHENWKRSAIGQGEGWPQRRPDHMLRVSLMLRISEFLDLCIDRACLEAANLALQTLEAGFENAFAYIGYSNIAKTNERIVEVIRKSGGTASGEMLYKSLYRYYSDIKALQLAIDTLRASGIIELMPATSTNSKEWWRLR